MNVGPEYDANGHLWPRGYDRLNRQTSQTNPLGQTWSSAYDAADNLSQVTKPDGTVNRFVSDRLGRRTGTDLQNNGSLDIQQTWDGASRRTSLIDATGTTSFGYDNANRLTSVAAPVTGTVGLGYDAAGRRISLTYPSGRVVTSGYTARGQLDTVADGLGTTSPF